MYVHNPFENGDASFWPVERENERQRLEHDVNNNRGLKTEDVPRCMHLQDV